MSAFLPDKCRMYFRSLRTALIAATSMACIAAHATTVDDVERPTQASAVALADEILDRWEPVAVAAGAHWASWREVFATQLGAMDMEILRGIDGVGQDDADSRGSYAQFAQSVRNAEMQLYMRADAGKTSAKLGSPTTDQIFVPIVPCRIVDTRNAGGPIAAGITRNFVFFANIGTFDWSSQGGAPGAAATTCPQTVIAGAGKPSAAVVTVTVVSPTAAGNWIIWGGANPIPIASALNWTGAGQIVANTTVVPSGARTGSGPGGVLLDFAVTYNGPSGSAQFVADVVGYLMENQATALDCYQTPQVGRGIASGQTLRIIADSCGPGYALTGGSCLTDKYSVRLKAKYYVGAFPQAAWSCTYHSDFDGVPQINVSSRCCRVPGRP